MFTNMQEGVAMAFTFNINSNNINGTIIQTNKKAGEGSKKTIHANGLNPGSDLDTQIAFRKKRAQKQAFKIIGDAWDKDKKSDEKLANKVTKKENNQQDISDLKDKIKDIGKFKEDLMEFYGIDPDSEEQKDLELLEKYQNNKLGVLFNEFSDEEINRLKELEKTELTEYQKKSLAFSNDEIDLKKQIEDLERQNVVLSEEIKEDILAELKNQNMQKADEAADEIMSAASKDIVGMIIQDGKDKVDKKAEEEKEKTKKLAEEKEEEQEKLEAVKERKTEQEIAVLRAREEKREQEKLLDNAIEAEALNTNTAKEGIPESNVEMAIRNIDKLMKNNNLLNEDIKGIEIDLDF